MTGFAHITGNRVSSGLKAWTTDPIVTTALCTRLSHNLTMIKSTQPGRGVMATFARRCRHNVSRPLTGSNHGVMAILTGVRGLGMIKG